MNAIKDIVLVLVFDIVADLTISFLCVAGFVCIARDKLEESFHKLRHSHQKNVSLAWVSIKPHRAGRAVSTGATREHGNDLQ